MALLQTALMLIAAVSLLDLRNQIGSADEAPV